MFTNDFGESFQNEIELQGVDPDALEALVTYCYTGDDTNSQRDHPGSFHRQLLISSNIHR